MYYYVAIATSIQECHILSYLLAASTQSGALAGILLIFDGLGGKEIASLRPNEQS